MNHLVAAPILLPAVVAGLAMLGRSRTLLLGRSVSIAAASALVLIAALLFGAAADGAITVYALGDWAAPFGIVLVLDRLSAMMLLVSAVLALLVLWYVIATGLDRRGWHFHPMFHFQLLGLNGAFLTGDLFNLFVFFEVLLIASYGLMLHGQGAPRLKAGLHYVIVNLVGSIIFLVAIGILYGVTGTLNMADLGVRVASLAEGDAGLVQAGAFLLMVVFGLKAALLPLHLWLPGTYANTSPAVAALFAIMTKVGVYSIIRVATLVFGAGAAPVPWASADWLLPAALLTTLIGYIGVVAAGRLRELSAFAVIGSTGTLLAAVSLFEADAMAAAIYYLPHSTFTGAALFLVSDLIGQRRGEAGGVLSAGARFQSMGTLSLLFLLAAIALVGLPPLSGFIGKLLILDAVRSHDAAGSIWGTILATTLLGMIGLARAGSVLFWKSDVASKPPLQVGHRLPAAEIAPAATMLVLLAALALFAGPASNFAAAAAQQLFAPATYVEAVLAPGGYQ